MLSAFPPDHELIGFFEAEPAILDPGVPWLYNTLTFETTRGDTHVLCKMSPSYRSLSVRLTIAEVERIDAAVGNVSSVRLDQHDGREALCATLQTRDGEGSLVLQLKPRVYLAWSVGT
jgi:hypothetical protein